MGFRPDALCVVTGPDGEPALRGVVRMVELRGHDALVQVETGCAPTPHDLSHLEFPDAPASSPRPRAVRSSRPRRSATDCSGSSRPVRAGAGRGAGRYAVQSGLPARTTTSPRPAGDLAVRVDAGAAPRPGDTLDLTLDHRPALPLRRRR